jgi:hypothetical protein
MAKPLDMLKFQLGRLGRVGAAGALLLAGALAWQQAVVVPRESALAAQLARNAELARAAAAQQAQAGEQAARGDQPTLAPAAVAALRRLFDAAQRAGVALDRGEYRLTEVKDAHLRRYQLSLPVAGGYPEIRAFVAQALNADPALALTAIQLRRERIESPDLEALVNFTLYLEAGA